MHDKPLNNRSGCKQDCGNETPRQTKQDLKIISNNKKEQKDNISYGYTKQKTTSYILKIFLSLFLKKFNLSACSEDAYLLETIKSKISTTRPKRQERQINRKSKAFT